MTGFEDLNFKSIGSGYFDNYSSLNFMLNEVTK